MLKGLRAPWTRRSGKPSNTSIRRTWDRERAQATSPSHRAEIDAIFSRYLCPPRTSGPRPSLLPWPAPGDRLVSEFCKNFGPQGSWGNIHPRPGVILGDSEAESP